MVGKGGSWTESEVLPQPLPKMMWMTLAFCRGSCALEWKFQCHHLWSISQQSWKASCAHQREESEKIERESEKMENMRKKKKIVRRWEDGEE